METTGRIVDINIDYISHKHKITLEIDDKELTGLEEIKNLDSILIKLSKPTKKRGLNANAYFWVLVQSIADKLESTKEEIYRDIIKDKGVFRTITISNDAINTFIYLWKKNGLGWICETINKGIHQTDLICYYGTSSYNSKQMATIIDYVVNQCKELGISTITPDEIEKLKLEWRNNNGKNNN